MLKRICSLLLLFLPLSLLAQVNSNAIYSNQQPEIRFDEYDYNFGKVREDTVIMHEFAFTNTGKSPLIVNDTHGTCHCIITEYTREPLAKNQKGKIKVIFDTKGRQGEQEKTITVNSNAKTAQVILKLKGMVESKN